MRKYNFTVYLIILLCCIIFLFIGVAYSFILPGMSDDETLKNYMTRLQESQIPDKDRKASLNKKPWMEGNDNLNAMESLAWPDYGFPDYPFERGLPDDVADAPYCAFYQPNICIDCEKPYRVRMGILHGIITDLSVNGPIAGWSVVPGTGNMKIDIEPLPNASYGSVAKVVAEVTSDALNSSGDKSSCQTTVQFYCEECECSGAIPTIYASGTTIDPGGSISMYVNSEGLACPNYQWTVAGTGYSIDKSITENDLEIVTLSCVAGVCGEDYDVYSTITVEDECGETYTVEIRSSSGQWNLIGASVQCYQIFTDCGSNDCDANPDDEYINGDQRWVIQYSGAACFDCTDNSWYKTSCTVLSERPPPPCGGPLDCSVYTGPCTAPPPNGNGQCAVSSWYYEWGCP